MGTKMYDNLYLKIGFTDRFVDYNYNYSDKKDTLKNTHFFISLFSTNS